MRLRRQIAWIVEENMQIQRLLELESSGQKLLQMNHQSVNLLTTPF